MNKFKTPTLYFFSMLCMMILTMINYFYLVNQDWTLFWRAAGVFLPISFALIIILTLLAFAIYLLIKASNFGKKKDTVRFL